MTQSTHLRFAALVATGFFVAASGIAHADTTTSGNGSLGGGNQLVVDGDLPINLCGNAIAVLGVAGANCTDGGASVTETGTPKNPHPGYDGHEPGEPGKPGEPEEPGTPGEPGQPGEPEEDKHEQQNPDDDPVVGDPEEPAGEQDKGRGEDGQSPSEEPSPAAPGTPERPADAASPSAPSADEQRLAVTGTDQSGLAALLAGAVLTVAAGIGLLLFGKRRRARA